MKPADLPLVLLAGLAACQLTLMTRSGPGAGDYAIMAALVWLGEPCCCTTTATSAASPRSARPAAAGAAAAALVPAGAQLRDAAL